VGSETEIEVSLMRYNGGDVKVQVSRYLRDDDTGKCTFRKLGRMMPAEAEAVAKAILGLTGAKAPDDAAG